MTDAPTATPAPLLAGAVQLDDLPPGLWACAPSDPVIVIDVEGRAARIVTFDGMTLTGRRGALLVVTSTPDTAPDTALTAVNTARRFLKAALHPEDA